MLSLSSKGKVTGWEHLSWPWAVLPWQRCDVSKVKLFLLLCPLNPNSYFLLQLCAGTSAVKTGICTKVLSSLGDCLKQCSLTVKRNWSHFMGHCRVHSQNQGLYVYYPTHGLMRLLPDPGRVILDPTASTKALLFVLQYQILLGGEMNEERVIQSYCWCHSPVPRHSFWKRPDCDHILLSAY